MGSWDETCALSGIGIQGDDPVVAVVVYTATYLSHYGRFTSYDDYKAVTHIIEGPYDTYGRVEGADDEIFDRGTKTVYFFHVAMWQWAVATWKPEFGETLSDADLMFRIIPQSDHLMAELVAERIKDDPDHIYAKVDVIHRYPERIIEFFKVANMCHRVRRPLAHPPSGPQFTSDSTKDQLALNNISLQMLLDLAADDDDDYIDDDDLGMDDDEDDDWDLDVNGR